MDNDNCSMLDILCIWHFRCFCADMIIIVVVIIIIIIVVIIIIIIIFIIVLLCYMYYCVFLSNGFINFLIYCLKSRLRKKGRIQYFCESQFPNFAPKNSQMVQKEGFSNFLKINITSFCWKGYKIKMEI